MRKRYAYAICACRRTGGLFTNSVTVFVTWADSDAASVGNAMAEAWKRWPKSEGWGEHQSTEPLVIDEMPEPPVAEEPPEKPTNPVEEYCDRTAEIVSRPWYRRVFGGADLTPPRQRDRKQEMR